MDLVIVHYHLQTGGVTRVIQQAVRALSSLGHRVLVLSGEPPQQPIDGAAAVAVLPGLRYEERRPRQTPDKLAASMLAAAREHLGTLPDLWHVHNHCLGKNLALPGALVRLTRHEQRLLLQPHDFAEDGRPALYQRLRGRLADGDVGRLSALLYPLAPQIHYAALNARDRRFLAAAGIGDDNLHLLPNAVSVPGPEKEATSARPAPNGCTDISRGERLWLYPTRAIRRKNLGEFLLWAAAAEPGDRFAATQAPQNPQEQPRYRRWARLAAELALPVELGLGERVADFGPLLACSHALVTTSVGEGFGLAFLEPWLGARPLAGRDLPEITADFRANGIDLSGLYRTLRVPLEWIDAARLRGAFVAALSAQTTAYGRGLPPDALDRAWAAATDADSIDMGRLDEPAQEAVIRHVHADPAARRVLQPAALAPADDPGLIRTNAHAVRDQYGLAVYGRRLSQIYAAITGAGLSARLEAADGDRLLDEFLAPERLTLLRT
jgi:hypothetical protein